ncbi:DnaJ domain-containing protein [Prochlorothrix hollandica]|uniref:DnaJ domain-containing protein n=1 Tax=Prochlorothrix hollandica TaxID=1223 RepID=UPI00333E9EC4
MTPEQAYQILQVQPGSTAAEIKTAYYRLVKEWHPDRVLDPQQRQQAEAKIKDINQAYGVLKALNTDHDGEFSRSTPKSKSVTVNSSTLSSEFFYKQGIEKARHKQYGAAIEDFTHAIRLNPNYLDAYRFRRLACLRLGYQHRAASDAKHIRRLEGQNDNSQPSGKPSTATSPPQSVSEPQPQTVKIPNPPTPSPKPLWYLVNTLPHAAPILCLAVSPDGHYCATAGEDGRIHLWSLVQGKEEMVFSDNSSPIQCLVFSPHNSTLISGNDQGKLMEWDLRDGTIVHQLQVHALPITSLAVHPLTPIIFSGSHDTTIKTSSLIMGQVLKTTKAHTGIVKNLAIALQSQILVSTGTDHRIKYWSLKGQKPIKTIETIPGTVINDLAISFDQLNFATAVNAINQNVNLWDLKTGHHQYNMPNPKGLIQSIEFSPDGQILACGSATGLVILWDLKKQEQTMELKVGLTAIKGVRFGLEGQAIVSFSDDQILSIWHRSHR